MTLEFHKCHWNVPNTYDTVTVYGGTAGATGDACRNILADCGCIVNQRREILALCQMHTLMLSIRA